MNVNWSTNTCCMSPTNGMQLGIPHVGAALSKELKGLNSVIIHCAFIVVIIIYVHSTDPLQNISTTKDSKVPLP